MEAAGECWRRGLFGFCAACLCLAAVLSAAAAPEQPEQPPQADRPSSRPHRREERERAEAAVRRAARPFLAAFLRYEVGEDGHAVRSTLRASAAPQLAAELLGSPPRMPVRRLAAARVWRLSVAFVSALPRRALVSGLARAGPRVERFSFLFEARDGRWLARGLGD